jgi:hypothetical protein
VRLCLIVDHVKQAGATVEVVAGAAGAARIVAAIEARSTACLTKPGRPAGIVWQRFVLCERRNAPILNTSSVRTYGSVSSRACLIKPSEFFHKETVSETLFKQNAFHT